MFQWFKSLVPASGKGLEKMTREFSQMLDSGRHIFITASNAVLGGTDPEVVRNEIFSIDKEINRSEQQVRREVVVHTSVHGTATVPIALTLMSVVKDAERIGDYAKNIFDLADVTPDIPRDEYHADLVGLKDRIGSLLSEVQRNFDRQEELGARESNRVLAEIEDICDAAVERLLKGQKEHPTPATLVLLYRYFKRVVSHARNVTSSIFMPVDMIDYADGDAPKE